MKEKYIYIAGVMSDTEAAGPEPKASVIGMFESMKRAIEAVKSWHETACRMLVSSKGKHNFIYTIETVTINTENPESGDCPIFFKGTADGSIWIKEFSDLEEKGPFGYSA